MPTTSILIPTIERYLAQHNLTRPKFAAMLGVAPDTVNKLLAGNLKFSDKMLTKIDAKTGLISSAKVQSFDFEVGRPARSLITHLEGEYQAVRPSFRHEGRMHTYVISISFEESLGGLVFEEKNNDLSPQNKGVVSIPAYNRMMYLLSCENGNFRLAILSDGYQPGIFYGMMSTVSSIKMIDKIPTSSLFVIKKLDKGQSPVFGIIEEDNEKHEELTSLLKFGREEGFYRMVE